MSKIAQRWTPNALAVECGVSRQKMGSILKRVKPIETVTKGKLGRYYHTYLFVDVLKAMMDSVAVEEGGVLILNPAQVKAQLDDERRQKVVLERQELEGLLCRREEVYEHTAAMINAAKSKLRGIPSKCLHQVMAAESFDEAIPIMDAAINEALAELSENGFD